MRIIIKNFAKISHADIKIDGITVIAGNNNTGKSTVGKVLDSMFYVGKDLDRKMENARVRRLARSLSQKFVQESAKEIYGGAGRYYPLEVFLRLSAQVLNLPEAERAEILHKFFYEQYLRNVHEKTEADSIFIEQLCRSVREIEQIPEDMLCRGIYTGYFGDVFHKQINSIYEEEQTAEILLQIKGKEIHLLFEKDECIHCERQLDLLNSSVYIDNPFVLDYLNNISLYSSMELPVMEENLCKKLLEKEDRGVEEAALDELLINERMKDIMEILNQVAAGQMTHRQRYMYHLPEETALELDIASLSTGLKAFVILKQLLLNGSLQEKDVIVLDEPEIHLHPEWQMIYAQIIVLLQKRFHFHIIITTHSSHFMEAVELFSKKYETEAQCRYYLTRQQEKGIFFEEVTGELEKIYKQMVSPALLLEYLREELA
ncbi:MAG: ATP-binding protein [Muribaculaceae bacterium]|nr:ATP-binding protein [Roseburia sp.]MCM1431789.1 ATP-binding protein [Muribaculaceae bacterium]MCM1493470.1 ATP-binding protein [Muribaculaceae bacterium]